jgi:uncharacterized protein (TIGR00730 family)
MSLPNDPNHKLPWQKIKPAFEDPAAQERVRVLLEHPGYRQADFDIDFLGADSTRGVRLQLDYQKAELALKKHGVEHTIVVFGSTRIHEPATALREVHQLQRMIEDANDASDIQSLKQRLLIAKRLHAKSHYYDVARSFGRLVGTSGKSPEDCRVTLMTGGGPGIMEAANRGAFDVGAQSIGLNIGLPYEQFPNPYITPELCFRFHYFALRKLHFLLRAKALVVFPGGFGTFDELFETITLVQTRKIDPVPIVLVDESYWRKAVGWDFLVEEGVIIADDLKLISFAETADSIWQSILQWHERNGAPLF